MDIYDDLDKEVEAASEAFVLPTESLDDPTPSLNVDDPPQQNPLVRVPVKGINLEDVGRTGGPIDFTAMGASLGIVKREAGLYLKKTDNPNTRIQHILITPASINNYASGQSKEDKSMRAVLCDRLKLPPMHTIEQDTYVKSELKLRIITPIRDVITNPEPEIFQWATMVVEIGKRPNEKYMGYRSYYFHPAHDDAGKASRIAMFQKVKAILGHMKQMVKFNLSQHQVKAPYKQYSKGTDNPVRMDSLLMTEPNDSGIAALLTAAAVINRIGFWQDTSSTSSTLTRLESGYVIDEQRECLVSSLQAELAKPCMQRATDVGRPGWVPNQLSLDAKKKTWTALHPAWSSTLS